MTNHEHYGNGTGHDPSPGGTESFLRRGRWVFWIFAIIAAGYLISEHRAHFVGILPFLIVLACPLLHMFMHGGGHGGHGGHTGRHEDPRKAPASVKSGDWKE